MSLREPRRSKCSRSFRISGSSRRPARGLRRRSLDANTERYSDVITGHNDTKENLFNAIERNEREISPSTLYAAACIHEKVPFINGSPQNTFVPGLIEYALENNSLIGGDDFKSGQTKMKSVLVDFLVSAGIKPMSIVSYNHLGNNDGMNLSAPQTFRSKEISKSNVVDDMVASNAIIYDKGSTPTMSSSSSMCPMWGTASERWTSTRQRFSWAQEHHCHAQHMRGLAARCSSHS
ncbi:hypothetical protein CLOM_g16437 [Closterium sp. NIES-68]|nr:hypothetical protein CLOM_g16437 [Closterium sp. NIES-68]